jgi:26S proteasome regulatory subunit N5
MTRREKTEFLLEQMRLLVLVAKMKGEAGKSQDGEAEWIKVRVGGRKVNEGFLKESENEVRRFPTMFWLRKIDTSLRFVL